LTYDAPDDDAPLLLLATTAAAAAAAADGTDADVGAVVAPFPPAARAALHAALCDVQCAF
jgi:hypothetical protein